MNIKQRIFYILTTIIQVVLLIGAYIINYFTKTRMGMARHVIHKNYVLENTYPIETIKYIILIILLILMIALLSMYIKRRLSIQNIVAKMNIGMVLLSVSFIGFIFIGSTEVIRSFYYVSTIFGLITLIQIIKVFIGIIWYKN